QVRVRGPVEVVDPAEVEAYFVTRPRPARLASWASRQSSVLPDRATLEAALAEMDARFPGDDIPMPSWVGGFRVVPDEVEFWPGPPGPPPAPSPPPPPTRRLGHRPPLALAPETI